MSRDPFRLKSFEEIRAEREAEQTLPARLSMRQSPAENQSQQAKAMAAHMAKSAQRRALADPLFAEGLNNRVIAARLGISDCAVSRWRKQWKAKGGAS